MGRQKARYSADYVRELDNRVLASLAAYCVAKGDEASADNCFREIGARPEAREALEIALENYQKSQFEALTGQAKPPASGCR